jgi:hypothetical protein
MVFCLQPFVYDHCHSYNHVMKMTSYNNIINWGSVPKFIDSAMDHVHATITQTFPYIDTHLLLGSNDLSNTTNSSTITTARKRMIDAPMNIPPALSPVLSSLAGSALPSGFLLVGLVSGEPTVVAIGGRDTNGQSGDLRVSSEVGQEASR